MFKATEISTNIRSSSAVAGNNLPTKLSAISKRDDLPWPSLIKGSPGFLTRTASTLMSEWEKSVWDLPHTTCCQLIAL